MAGEFCQYRIPDYRHQTNTNSGSSTSSSEETCCPLNSNCCKTITSCLSSLAIFSLVLSYTVLGALTFMTLEGRAQEGGARGGASSPGGPDKLRAATVEKLWSITEDLNILYKENWTRLAEQEVLKFQDSLIRKYHVAGVAQGNATLPVPGHRWNFPSSFLYCLTLITTIGCGSVSPRTPWGRIVTIFYALIGIPLMLIYLSTIGEFLANNFRRLYHCLGGKKKSPPPPPQVVGNHVPKDYKAKELYSRPPLQPQHVPLLVSLVIIILYIVLGAAIFNKLENWTFLEGSYFCFISLGTIGFGDFVPGSMETTEKLSVFASSAYILVGMAIISMCFNLIQEEILLLTQKFNHPPVNPKSDLQMIGAVS
nr:PREDICTED: potassium channel subfamily K member 16 isoform X2 [Bemisia tabaci]XP_018898296.1 PREDICTED: potassium channel subfamily K member 16 isoform X2 [Bemisia tabaci]